jgi:HEAT repeat protein
LLQERYLCHPDPDIRRLAIETLGMLEGRQAFRKIAEAARDPHWSVRIAALHLIGTLGTGEEVRHVIAALDDPDRMVRKHAIETLGEMKDPSTIPALIIHLEDLELGRLSFEALLKFGRAALPTLHRQMVKNYRVEIRVRIIDVVGKIGDRRSVDPLMDLLDDPQAAIRLEAIDALVSCFDCLPLKKLDGVRRHDVEKEVRERAVLALKTLIREDVY